MAYPTPSGSFLHATLYSSLLLQVSRELFPAQPFFDLSPDKRRLVDQEAGNLLLQAKWKVDSQGFAEFFSQPMPPQAGGNEAPAGTILGERPPEPKRPGQYAQASLSTCAATAGHLHAATLHPGRPGRRSADAPA